MMSDPIVLPTPEEIHRRIVACRSELKELRWLQKLSLSVRRAAEARKVRQPPQESCTPGEAYHGD
jgi:hypothetical protein